MFIAKKGSFAAVAKLDQKEAVQKALKSGGGAGSAARLESWIGKNDISGVLTAKGLKEVSAKMLDGLGFLKGALAQAPPGAGEIAGSVLGGLEDFVKSAQTDVTTVAAGLRLDKAGTLHMQRGPFLPRAAVLPWVGPKPRPPKAGPLPDCPLGRSQWPLGALYPKTACRA